MLDILELRDEIKRYREKLIKMNEENKNLKKMKTSAIGRFGKGIKISKIKAPKISKSSLIIRKDDKVNQSTNLPGVPKKYSFKGKFAKINKANIS